MSKRQRKKIAKRLLFVPYFKDGFYDKDLLRFANEASKIKQHYWNLLHDRKWFFDLAMKDYI